MEGRGVVHPRALQVGTRLTTGVLILNIPYIYQSIFMLELKTPLLSMLIVNSEYKQSRN